MKTLFRTVLGLGVLAGLAGCAKENIIPDGPSDGEMVKVTFSATQEGAQTRTSVGADGKTVNWSEADAISVFDGKGNTEYKITSGVGTTSATFDSDDEIQKADSYIALYPYQSKVSMSDGTLYGVTLKSEQTAVAGSFDPSAALMMAQTESGSLSLAFKNVVGYVKVTPQFDCRKITLIAKGEGNMLAGTLELKMNGDTPGIVSVIPGSSSVSISGDIKAGSAYYIAVRPWELDSGFKLVFTDDKGKGKYRESSKTLDINKGRVVNLGAISESDLQEEDTTPYVTFSADAEQTFKMEMIWPDSHIGPFWYSVGGGEWTEYSFNTSVTFGGELGGLRLRGKSKYGTAYDYVNSTISFGNAEAKVKCTGDIRTLIDWEDYEGANTANAVFQRLFADCTALVSAPDLPSEDLADGCYSYMFDGCTSLETAPEELPAQKLTEDCYRSMFYGCSSLEDAPSLPANVLAENCYRDMFSGCSSLESAPELKVEDLSKYPYCYAYMFSDCTSLVEAPALPAGTLSEYCYCGMFDGCTSLTEAPALNAMGLASNCYEKMFQGTGVVTAPALPAVDLKKECYFQMFYKCAELVNAPVLPAENLATYCYSQMFCNCPKLVSVTVKAKTTASRAFANWLVGTAVGTTGVIHKRQELTFNESGTVEVPSNWTTVDDVTD